MRVITGLPGGVADSGVAVAEGAKAAMSEGVVALGVARACSREVPPVGDEACAVVGSRDGEIVADRSAVMAMAMTPAKAARARSDKTS